LSLTAAGICRKHYPLTGISRENLPGFLQPAKTSAAARTLFSSPVPKLPSLYPLPDILSADGISSLMPE